MRQDGEVLPTARAQRSASAYDVSFRDSFWFGAPPAVLWDALARTELFEQWWSWIREVELEGQALAVGSTISFRIEPPVPYRMRISVSVTAAEPPHAIAGDVSGDLRGTSELRFVPEAGGTRADVRWDVEIASRPIRAVIKVARPVLLWAQHWAVAVSLRGFRTYLARRR